MITGSARMRPDLAASGNEPAIIGPVGRRAQAAGSSSPAAHSPA